MAPAPRKKILDKPDTRPYPTASMSSAVSPEMWAGAAATLSSTHLPAYRGPFGHS